MRSAGATLDIPDAISDAEAKALIKGGWAVDADVKDPAPEKEAEVIAAVAQAKSKPDVDKAVDSVEKPTSGILAAAESKIKSFTKRTPYKPGSRKKEE